VENSQKTGILIEIGDNHIFPQKCVFPTPDTLKVGLTLKFDHLSRCGVRNRSSKFTIFTREYTKCTAGSTFCFVVVVLVVVVVGKPLIKLASISADS
jgi:hypothetical protein